MIVGAWNYIRLRGGISNYSGRVEVKIAGAWGQICGRYWSRNVLKYYFQYSLQYRQIVKKSTNQFYKSTYHSKIILGFI
jgi:hypothetical protein